MKNLKRIVFGILAMLVMVTSVDAAETFEQCISNASESTVCELAKDYTLSNDIVVDKNLTINLKGNVDFGAHRIEVNAGKTLTLDGNGFTIDADGLTDGRSVVFVHTGATVTIKNVTIDGGTVYGTQTGETAALVGASVDESVTTTTINLEKDATLKGARPGMTVVPAVSGNAVDHVVLNVNGKIETDSICLSVNGMINPTADPVVVNVGETAELTSKSVALYAAGYAIYNVTGATITGYDALSIRSGKVNITGGTYTGTGNYTGLNDIETNRNTNGKAVLTGAAINVASAAASTTAYAGKVELNIDGGTFTSKKGPVIIDVTSGTHPSVIKNIVIDGNGTFVAEASGVTSIMVLPTCPISNFIKSGTFIGKNPNATINSSWVDSSKGEYKNEDGEIVLGELHKVNVSSIINKTTKGEGFETIEFTAPEGSIVNLAEKLCAGKAATCKTDYKFAYAFNTVARSAEAGIDEFTMPGNDVNLTVTISDRAKLKLTVKYELPANISLNSLNLLGLTLNEDNTTYTALEGIKYNLNSLLGTEDAKTYVVTYTLTTADGTTEGVGTFTMPGADATLVIKVVLKSEVPADPEPADPTPDEPVVDPGQTEDPGKDQPSNNPEDNGSETDTNKGETDTNTGNTENSGNTSTDENNSENPSTLDSIVSIVTLAISSLGTAGYSIKKFIRK